jgi:hypothetical protein
MIITINGKPADITLENEKTVGEVLSGIQTWIEGTGFSVSGLEIDGKSYGSLTLDKAFELQLAGLSSINVQASGWADLLMEALTSLLTDLEMYENARPEEQKNFKENWALSAPALFLKDNEKDFYTLVLETVNAAGDTSSGTLPIIGLIPLVSERIRELKGPAEEMKLIRPLAEETAKRLEDLPLDMQTGNDSKAAETIAIFLSLLEKIFRLLFLFKYFKTDIESIEVPSMNCPEKQNLKDYIGEFSAALKELISAFENKDTILVGDLAEYELAPRLRCLCDVLCMEVQP